MVNHRVMKCGKSVIAVGVEGSMSDIECKRDACLLCDKRNADPFICEYAYEYTNEEMEIVRRTGRSHLEVKDGKIVQVPNRDSKDEGLSKILEDLIQRVEKCVFDTASRPNRHSPCLCDKELAVKRIQSLIETAVKNERERVCNRISNAIDDLEECQINFKCIREIIETLRNRRIGR